MDTEIGKRFFDMLISIMGGIFKQFFWDNFKLISGSFSGHSGSFIFS